MRILLCQVKSNPIIFILWDIKRNIWSSLITLWFKIVCCFILSEVTTLLSCVESVLVVLFLSGPRWAIFAASRFVSPVGVYCYQTSVCVWGTRAMGFRLRPNWSCISYTKTTSSKARRSLSLVVLSQSRPGRGRRSLSFREFKVVFRTCGFVCSICGDEYEWIECSDSWTFSLLQSGTNQ